MKPIWISVKDDLPMRCEQVLTYSPEYSPMPIKVNYLNHEGDWVYDISKIITHWMYLPEKPSEDDR